MPELPRLPAARVITALQHLGFRVVRQKGSHVVLRCNRLETSGEMVRVSCVVRQADVDVETFLDSL